MHVSRLRERVDRKVHPVLREVMPARLGEILCCERINRLRDCPVEKV